MNMKSNKKSNRIGEERVNNQGCLMKIVEYNNTENIVVEFQDDHKMRVETQYCNFKLGNVRNPYYPSVYGVGITGKKYPININCKPTREYSIWHSMLCRCFDERFKISQPAYKNTTCCNEWLNFEIFYEWLHSQENFDKWYNGKWWALDKDILVDGNKIYSPETCCLVPQNVNCLLLKRKASRGDLPIGVGKTGNKFQAVCSNPFTGKIDKLGKYETPEEAFYAYKYQRENYIKQVAEIEYKAGNITRSCYEALMNYSIKIDD